MHNRSLLIVFAILLLAAPALSQTNSVPEGASVKSWIFTDSSKTSTVPTGITPLQKFAEVVGGGLKEGKMFILVEPSGPVGLDNPFRFKSDVISVLQPDRPLNVPEKTHTLTMTPLAISPTQVTLQVAYNSVLPFTVELRRGEVSITEITAPGQKNRMFLAVLANDAR